MEAKSLSVVVRLRRARVEHAFVAVPVGADLLREDGMNVEALLARAAELGRLEGVEWRAETTGLPEPHPLQTPVPEGMEVFPTESGGA